MLQYYNMEEKSFKILSIDGGGIRGVFPAMFLASLEAELKSKGFEKWQIYQHFDLICGTSTGGILAIALALGIPAINIFRLYMDNAATIFGNKRNLLKSIFLPSYDRKNLEALLKETFTSCNQGIEPRLADCKTNVCIPIYDLLHGKPSICKNKYHPKFTRDYHIPAYQVALATAAAPTYFNPYSTKYKDLNGIDKTFSNKVDGGVVANNPALVGIIEAQSAFYQPLSNLRVLSIGTGYRKFTDSNNLQKCGLKYWVLPKPRILELFMQGQSQQVENLISLMYSGIDGEKKGTPTFVYKRVNTEFDGTSNIEMDETNRDKLNKLAEKATFEFSSCASEILKNYFV